MFSKFSSPLMGALFGIFGLLILLSASAAVVFFGNEHYSSHILPRVRMNNGTSLSGLSFADASALLVQQTDELLHQPIVVTYNDEKRTLTPYELGVRFDTEESLAPLRSTSQAGSFFDKIALSLEETTVPFYATVDPLSFQERLFSEFSFELTAPEDASISYSGLKDAFIITDSAVGSSINVEDFYNSLLKRATTANIESFTFALKDISLEPNLSSEIAKSSIERIENLYSSSSYLHIKEDSHELSPSLLRSWTVFSPSLTDSDTVIFEPGLNTETVSHFLESFARKLGEVPKRARLAVDVSGNVFVKEPGQSGVTLSSEEQLLEFERDFFSGKTDLVIAPIVTEPLVNADNLASLGLLDRIGVASSDFEGSTPDRVHNVTVGANKFNGVLMAPDEEFSFNTTLGSADAKDGFVNAFVIRGTDIIPSLGGGLCQVSTTVFRAANVTGLPITERYPHSFHVSYYGDPGYDATIWLGGKDFKFKNDTPGHIYLQTSIVGTVLTFEVFGTSDGREVSVVGPNITKRNPNGSMYTSLTREVIYADGTSNFDSFPSFYKPRSSFQTPAEKAAAEAEERRKEEEAAQRVRDEEEAAAQRLRDEEEAAQRAEEERAKAEAQTALPTPEPTPTPDPPVIDPAP